MPEQGEDGKWYQTWEVRDYTAEEAAEALDRAKQHKIREINRAYDVELDVILDKYPRAETLTWDKQDTEARAWKAWDQGGQSGTEPSTPYIDTLAASRGVTKAQAVDKVITKSDDWIALSGQATGKRQALKEQIEAATTQAELDGITWEA